MDVAGALELSDAESLAPHHTSVDPDDEPNLLVASEPEPGLPELPDPDVAELLD